MLELHAEDWFEITGRGTVAAIKELPEGHHVYDPRQFRGWRVRIDGREYDITGVETTLGYVPTPDRPYKGAFGLLVKEVPSEPRRATMDG